MDTEIKRDTIAIEGGIIEIVLYQDEDGCYYITIDGVEWCDTDSMHHAVILFELLRDHVTEKMTYKKRSFEEEI